MARWFPFLLLPLGYILGWFVFGLSPLSLALLLLVLMLALAHWQDKRRGIAHLVAFTLLLAGTALLVGSVMTLVALFSTATTPADFVLPVAAAAFMISLVILAPLVLWLRRTKPSFPAAPWLLLSGMLAFAFFPAVRVDCRHLQRDDFLSFSSNFQSHALQVPRWVRQPQSLPNRAELPANFKVEQVRAGLVGCQRTPFTFQAVRPLLIVHLTDHVQPDMKAFAAAFSLEQHRKLTRWVAVQEMPFSLALSSYKVGYGVPGWSTFPSYPVTPPEVAAALGKK